MYDSYSELCFFLVVYLLHIFRALCFRGRLTLTKAAPAHPMKSPEVNSAFSFIWDLAPRWDWDWVDGIASLDFCEVATLW